MLGSYSVGAAADAAAGVAAVAAAGAAHGAAGVNEAANPRPHANIRKKNARRL